MKNLNLNLKKGYDIYEIEEYKIGRYYVAVRKTIFGKEKAQKINFDVDLRGGLKIIFLEEIDLNCNGIKRTLVFSNVNGDFIPVELYKRLFGDNGEFLVTEKVYKIFENKYLKNKPKYALYDGVVEKIVFSRVDTFEGRNLMDYTHHLYRIA